MPSATSKTRVPGVPEGYTTVCPWIISRDTSALIAFVTAAFDAIELSRLADENGRISHAEFRIADSVILAFDTRAEWPDRPAFLRLFVLDADRTVQQALDAGATVMTNVTPMPLGDRVGRVRDPLGHVWWIQQRVDDIAPAEMERRMGDPAWIERMSYVMSSLVIE